MAIISYTDHLNLRLTVRKISYSYPRKIYEKPEQNYFDNTENNFISIKKLYYNKKVRNIMIAYEKTGNRVNIITIHPITDEKIINRLINGRWVKNG
ncbi:hypothetical protein HYU06_02720 [Candidatus Woesearchaeota archaeon]|nr:hypothetical protein [Candidatus Woesearchaeota archaeon]